MPELPVLIIDDNPLNLKLLRVTLSVGGYEVRTATDAADALRVLAEFEPRLILMDLQLPDVDGFELTHRLRSHPRYKAIKIVAVTAFAMKGDEQRALDAGCDGYLSKPIDTRALAATLERYIGPGEAVGPGDT